MSRAVSDHLTWWVHSEGVPLVATKRAGASNQRLVLLNLCAHADHAGCAWPSQSRTAKVLGISRQTVQDCLTALEEQGHLERLNKNAKPGALVRWRVLPPVLADLFARTPDGQPDGQPDGRPDGLARHEGEVEGKYPPTPQTAPKRERVERPGGKAREWGERHTQVLAGCIERERKRTRGEAGAGLVRKWESDYRPIIEQALRENPGWNEDTLVTWCVRTRNHEPGKVTTPTTNTNPACETCKGHPWVPDPTTGDMVRCSVCYPTDTQEMTHKRVTAERAPNTDTPTQGDQADPRSDQVGDLAKRLRRVV